jgi:hypothetical protein
MGVKSSAYHPVHAALQRHSLQYFRFMSDDQLATTFPVDRFFSVSLSYKQCQIQLAMNAQHGGGGDQT